MTVNGADKIAAAAHVEHADVVESADQVTAVTVEPRSPLRRWYWPILFASIAMLGGTLMLVGTLVITIQRADKAEQAVVEAEQALAEQNSVALEGRERDACYDRHVALIADVSVNSRIALNRLVVVLSDDTATEQQRDARIDAAVEALEDVDAQAIEARKLRARYVADGQPLPCPLSSTLQPVEPEGD